ALFGQLLQCLGQFLCTFSFRKKSCALTIGDSEQSLLRAVRLGEKSCTAAIRGSDLVGSNTFRDGELSCFITVGLSGQLDASRFTFGSSNRACLRSDTF